MYVVSCWCFLMVYECVTSIEQDFETIAAAVPLVNQSRPYEQLCFQYSLHTQELQGSEVGHSEFLAEESAWLNQEGDDPQLSFVQALVRDLHAVDGGSIVVYNSNFEKARLRALAKKYPEYDEAIAGLIHRLVDLADPFRSMTVYRSDTFPHFVLI